MGARSRLSGRGSAPHCLRRASPSDQRPYGAGPGHGHATPASHTHTAGGVACPPLPDGHPAPARADVHAIGNGYAGVHGNTNAHPDLACAHAYGLGHEAGYGHSKAQPQRDAVANSAGRRHPLVPPCRPSPT
jgi:hypothetical protein